MQISVLISVRGSTTQKVNANYSNKNRRLSTALPVQYPHYSPRAVDFSRVHIQCPPPPMFIRFPNQIVLFPCTVSNWRTWGDSELYNAGKLFDDKTGRFKTDVDGYFLCSTQVHPLALSYGKCLLLFYFSFFHHISNKTVQIRLDGTSPADYFRVFIGINGAKDYNNVSNAPCFFSF